MNPRALLVKSAPVGLTLRASVALRLTCVPHGSGADGHHGHRGQRDIRGSLLTWTSTSPSVSPPSLLPSHALRLWHEHTQISARGSSCWTGPEDAAAPLGSARFGSAAGLSGSCCSSVGPADPHGTEPTLCSAARFGPARSADPGPAAEPHGRTWTRVPVSPAPSPVQVQTRAGSSGTGSRTEPSPGFSAAAQWTEPAAPTRRDP